MAKDQKPTNTKNIEQKIVPSGGLKKGLTTPVVPTINPLSEGLTTPVAPTTNPPGSNPSNQPSSKPTSQTGKQTGSSKKNG